MFSWTNLSFHSTKLVIGGQLAKHAITEGTKAIRQYNRNTGHNYR
jgi:hypothetical protein